MQPDSLCEPGLTWFVYYRVDPDRARSVVKAARRLIGRLCATCPGLHGQLMQRPRGDTQDGALTLMEIYRLPPTLDAPAALALRHTLDGLAAELLGSELARQRHVEVFEPCA